MTARKMKDSGIEWIGEIPEVWKVAKVGLFFSFKSGDTLTSEQIEDEGRFPVYGANGIRGYYDEFNLNGKNILIGRVGALCGNVHISDGPIWVTEHALITMAKKLIVEEFYGYVFASMNLIQYSKASAQPVISSESLSNLRFPVPPLPEQHRIADFLDRKCAEIDRVVAETEKTIEEYKVLKQSIITEAVTKGVRGKRPMKDSGIEWIGEIPEEWKTIRVKYLLKERNERSEFGLEEPLSMSQKLGLIPTKDMDMVPNMASSFVGAKLAHMDDLVFNKLKAHLGVFSVSRYNGLVSPDYAVYYSTGKVNLKYLEYLFKTPQCISEFRKKSTGIAAGLTRLYTDGLFSVVLPFPSLCEQEEVVAELDRKCAEIDRLVAAKQDLLAELATYKKSVIYEYVTGKKEVPECL